MAKVRYGVVEYTVNMPGYGANGAEVQVHKTWEYWDITLCTSCVSRPLSLSLPLTLTNPLFNPYLIPL